MLDPQKMTVIINIQNMQTTIGVPVTDFNSLITESYNDLHEKQNDLIKSYNSTFKS